jgi:indolepyruvate ferredoxin oxidoreductase beta subunit
MSVRPITLLIAALGGEGGGVLTGWIVEAAQAAGLPVQATSIPGVAQRTGATTYYIEIWPETREALGGREPVLALSPAPGEVDIMLASELLEAGRAIQTGLVTPDRTTLIASTHRVLTTREKMAMGDGRFDSAALMAAAQGRAQACLLADLAALAKSASAPLGSVMLGALAGTGKLPIRARHFRDAIKAGGKAEKANLNGFEAGLAIDWNVVPAARNGAGKASLDATIAGNFPVSVHEMLGHAVARLTDYQDETYARLYLDRLAPFAEGDGGVLESVARQLALRMSYEDIFRVAQAKIRPGRLSRILGEAGAGEGDAVTVTEFFRPGFAEIRDVLPRGLARWLNRRKGLRGWSKPMELRSTTVWGYLRLRLLAGLRRFRRASWRYAEEQAQIESWLDNIVRAVPLDTALATEIAECARLIKGYGDTHRRGLENFQAIEDALIGPALAGQIDPPDAAARIAQARAAALSDPDGDALAACLASSLRRAAE